MVPPSPGHRRRQSSISVNNFSNHSRRSSTYSTPSKRSSQAFGNDSLSPLELDSRALGSSFGVGDGNDLGNLEDELEDAWEGGYQETEDGDNSQLDGGIVRSPTPPAKDINYDLDKFRDSGVHVPTRTGSTGTSANTSPTHRRKSSGTRFPTRRSRGQTLSQWEEEEIIDGISKSLQACMRDVELLANATTLADGTIEEEPDARNTITGFIDSLRDLPRQHGNLETNTTRLVTAHTSLATHMAHSVRTIQPLAYQIVSLGSSASTLEVNELDGTLEALDAALESLPRPTVDVRTGLERLSSSTRNLAATLSELSDSLHMARQLTETATRRLKGTRDMVTTLRKELRQAEEGRLGIDDGGWDEKLARREGAAACQDILSGFDKACNDWRQRLLDGQTNEHPEA